MQKAEFEHNVFRILTPPPRRSTEPFGRCPRRWTVKIKKEKGRKRHDADRQDEIKCHCSSLSCLYIHGRTYSACHIWNVEKIEFAGDAKKKKKKNDSPWTGLEICLHYWFFFSFPLALIRTHPRRERCQNTAASKLPIKRWRLSSLVTLQNYHTSVKCIKDASETA